MIRKRKVSKEKALSLIEKNEGEISSIELFFGSPLDRRISKEYAREIIDMSKTIKICSWRKSLYGHRLEVVFEDSGVLSKLFLQV